jgi:lysophospholipase L1-like esterase
MPKRSAVLPILFGAGMTAALAGCSKNVPDKSTRFSDFVERARAGERLNVVYFGASLTWGANATDQNLSSYRAYMSRRLEDEYPAAHFRFYDAAIGGPGSNLGIYRVDRDVLSRHPDLVFVDFTANDGIYDCSPDALASYEAIIRRLVLEANCPVVMAIFPFKRDVEQGRLDGMKTRDAHYEMAKAYDIPVGDAVEYLIGKAKAGEATPDAIWPHDVVHPCDYGYERFTDAVWAGFMDGVNRTLACKAPDAMLNADTYMKSARVRIPTLGELPQGWKVGTPSLTSAWFDALMSRWLDELAVASPGAKPLEVKFNGSTVLLFGEASMQSGKYRVLVDGKEVSAGDASGKRFGGNTHLTLKIAAGLDATIDHTLSIIPEFDAPDQKELKIESICVAGGKAKVWLEK